MNVWVKEVMAVPGNGMYRELVLGLVRRLKIRLFLKQLRSISSVNQLKRMDLFWTSKEVKVIRQYSRRDIVRVGVAVQVTTKKIERADVYRAAYRAKRLPARPSGVVPFVQQGIVGPTRKDVDSAVTPGNCRWVRGQHTAQGLPDRPLAVPPLVPKCVVVPPDEDIQAPRGPRRDVRARTQHYVIRLTKRLPSSK